MVTGMRGFFAFALSGLVIVALSALPPEQARWFALALLALIVVTPAVGRRVQAGAEDPANLKIGARSSDSQ